MKDNRELILRLYMAFSKKDIEELEKICAPDIVWRQNPGFPGGIISTGYMDVIKNVYNANSCRWKYFSFMRKDITVAGDTIVVEGVYTVQGHGAESKVSAETAHVFKVKEGRVISFQQYTDSKTLWDNYLQNKGENNAK